VVKDSGAWSYRLITARGKRELSSEAGMLQGVRREVTAYDISCIRLSDFKRIWKHMHTMVLGTYVWQSNTYDYRGRTGP
jgi:hypothetical protein